MRDTETQSDLCAVVAPPGKGKRRVIVAGVLCLLPIALYAVVYVANCVMPMVLRTVIPESCYEAFIELRLLGKVEIGHYDSGGARFIKRYLPRSSSLIYGTMYEPHGEWVSYAPDGTVGSRIRFPNPTGKWMEWHRNGNPKEEINYRDGKYHGRWCVWKPDGQKGWEKDYQDGKEHGVERMWYENGALYLEAHWANGVMVGIGRKWHANGRLKQRSQRGPNRYHLLETWREDGTKESSKELVDGVPHGRSAYWDRSGALVLEEWFRRKRRHGRRRRWLPNGTMLVEQNYENGEPNGVWVSYSPQGKLLSKLTFPGATGLWIEYEDANTYVETTYARGEAKGKPKRRTVATAKRDTQKRRGKPVWSGG